MTRRTATPPSPVSRSIQQAVKAQPGIHFRGLARAAHVTSAGQLRHHLDRLERQGVLVEIPDGRYKRFFVAGDQDPGLRLEMARFSRPLPRQIAKLLLRDTMNRTELRRSLDCADSTLGYHLARMVALGDLLRTRNPSDCLYSLTDSERVRRILQQGNVPITPITPLPSEPASEPDDDVPNPLRPRRPLPPEDPERDDLDLTGSIGADWPIVQPDWSSPDPQRDPGRVD